jgi:hypothetical protein
MLSKVIFVDYNQNMLKLLKNANTILNKQVIDIRRTQFGDTIPVPTMFVKWKHTANVIIAFCT